MYLREQIALGLLLQERTDFLEVSAGADVLDVRAILYLGDVGTFVLRVDCWASLLGKLVFGLVIERADSSRL